MKINIIKTQIPIKETNTEPKEYKVEVTATGDRVEVENFFDYVAEYGTLKQMDKRVKEKK